VLHKSKMGVLKAQLYEQNINYSYSFSNLFYVKIIIFSVLEVYVLIFYNTKLRIFVKMIPVQFLSVNLVS